MKQKIRIILLHCFYIIGVDFLIKFVSINTFLSIEQFQMQYPENSHPLGITEAYALFVMSFFEEFAFRTFMDGKIKNILISVLASINIFSIIYVYYYSSNSQLLMLLMIISLGLVILFALTPRIKSNILNRKINISIMTAHLISIGFFVIFHIPKFYIGTGEILVTLVSLLSIAYSAYIFGRLRIQYGLYMAMWVHLIGNIIVSIK